MIIPAVSTAFEVLVQAFHYRHVVAHFVAQFVAQSVWKSKCHGIIRGKYVMISAAYLVCDARKWCPHTDSNRGPPDNKSLDFLDKGSGSVMRPDVKALSR